MKTTMKVALGSGSDTARQVGQAGRDASNRRGGRPKRSGDDPIRFPKEAFMSGGLVVLISAVFAVQFLLWPTSAEARFHRTLKEVAGHPERSAECAQGDTKVVRKIVSNTIKHAKERYKLAPPVVDDADTKRAENEMYDFLNWKIGSPSAVCGQYITAGQHHFNNGYSDEAAAALVGMELPGAPGKAQFRLPKYISDQLKAQIKACTEEAKNPQQQREAKSSQQQTSPQQAGTEKRAQQFGDACKKQMSQLAQKLEKEYGIPKELVNKRIDEISNASLKGVDRVGFNMPKSWDVENSLVETLIANRRAQKAGR
jgi:hypothetical protein